MSTQPTPDPAAPNRYFDEEALARFLRDRLPGFDDAFAVHQFQAGQSNPTFRLTTPAGDYVLRKKPAGKLLPSAHAIDREYAFMAALSGHVPVPRVHVLCEDESVIGQAFYVMEHVEGRVLPDARMLGAEKSERHAMCIELVSVLGRLHSVDYRKAGLERFGRPEGYVARQLARWSRQYAEAGLDANADMDRLIAWLHEHLPPGDEKTVVHGDYRTHNVIYAPGEPRIAAVLDWELATIGHPLTDLAYCCLPYYVPADDMRGFQGLSLLELGVPSEDEMLAAYCRVTGRSELPHWRYHVVFSLFRSAAIRAGVYKRAMDGTAANPEAKALGERYLGTAAFAWNLVQS